MGWTRSRNLPANWRTLRRQASKRAGGRCERVHPNGVRCPRPGTELHHAGDPDDHRLDQLVWLCADCHAEETRRQSARAIRRRWARTKHPAAGR